MTEPLELVVEGTPNPNALKFTLNRTIAASGKTYRDAATADAPWAKQLLGIAGVSQVFAVNDFISMTKRPEADWDVIVPQAEQVLRQVFSHDATT